MNVFVDRNGDVAVLVDHAEEVARTKVLLFGQRGMEQVPASTGGIESLLLRHGEGRVLFWRIHVKRVVLRNQLAEDDSIKL